MEKLKFGETAVLENGKEYICFSELEENGTSYVYLITNSKPLEVRFAKQTLNNGELELTIIEDQNEKQHLLNAFAQKNKKNL